MPYLVNLTARAERDLEYLYTAINAEQSDAALEWYRGMKEAILSLKASPNRCPVTPENPRLRHLLYGRKPHVYRVIYRVGEKRKRVDNSSYPPRRTAEVHASLSAMVDGLSRGIRTRA